MPLMDGMIQTMRLSEFVDEFVTIYNDEKKDSMLWDIWLYRVHDKSYSEFLEAIGEGNKEQPTEQETADIVRESKGILNSFRSSTTTE